MSFNIIQLDIELKKQVENFEKEKKCALEDYYLNTLSSQKHIMKQEAVFDELFNSPDLYLLLDYEKELYGDRNN